MKIKRSAPTTIEFNYDESVYLFDYIYKVENLDKWLKRGELMHEDLNRIIFETVGFECVDENKVLINEKNKLWNERKLDLKRFKKYMASRGYVNGKQYKMT